MRRPDDDQPDTELSRSAGGPAAERLREFREQRFGPDGMSHPGEFVDEHVTPDRDSDEDLSTEVDTGE